MNARPQDKGPISVVPATPERWRDVEALFVGAGCWCQYWRVSANAYGRVSKAQLHGGRLAERRDALLNQLEGPLAPGMRAYVDNHVVGWCGFGPRHTMERLAHSRTIPQVDSRPVWAIVCFLVRVGYRRRGVARALLHGVIEYAQRQGAPALEAYPVDFGGRRVNATGAYVGTVSMFEEAGFSRVTETSARSAGLSRWLMRLELPTSSGNSESGSGGPAAAM